MVNNWWLLNNNTSNIRRAIRDSGHHPSCASSWAPGLTIISILWLLAQTWPGSRDLISARLHSFGLPFPFLSDLSNHLKSSSHPSCVLPSSSCLTCLAFFFAFCGWQPCPFLWPLLWPFWPLLSAFCFLPSRSTSARWRGLMAIRWPGRTGDRNSSAGRQEPPQPEAAAKTGKRQTTGITGAGHGTCLHWAFFSDHCFLLPGGGWRWGREACLLQVCPPIPALSQPACYQVAWEPSAMPTTALPCFAYLFYYLPPQPVVLVLFWFSQALCPEGEFPTSLGVYPTSSRQLQLSLDYLPIESLLVNPSHSITFSPSETGWTVTYSGVAVLVAWNRPTRHECHRVDSAWTLSCAACMLYALFNLVNLPM